MNNKTLIWKTQEDFLKILGKQDEVDNLSLLISQNISDLTFIKRCLSEKERFKYLAEISDLKLEIEDFKIKLETKEHKIKRLQSARYRIKNYNFWDRVKFLFKKKGELL